VNSLHYPGYVGERELRVYRPTANGTGVIVLFHGGGFLAGGLDAAAPVAAEMADRLRLAVVTPAYTLASEHPFPAAAEDAYAALTWVSTHSRHERWDSRQMVVAGYEAGGNLAAVAAMMVRDRGGPALLAQVLMAPMLDPSLSARSMHCTSGIERGAAYRAYLPNAADRMHPYAAPAASSRLVGLPPTLILSAVDDPLRDEAEIYGAKLIAAGVTTHVSRLPRIAADAQHLTDVALDAIDAFLAPRLLKKSPA